MKTTAEAGTLSPGRSRGAGRSTRSARVCIVIPAFNAEKTLDRTLASVCAQTSPHWTAVVVDDGSTDRTFEIATDWSARDGRIRAIRQENRGVAAARNAGLAAAQTEWLLFLDADDYLHKDALRRLLDASAARPDAVVVAGGATRVDSEGRTWRFPKFDLSDAFSVLSGECALVIHSAIVRRETVVEVGGFDESLRSAEDWDLWQRVARTGGAFHQIDPLVAFYQSQPGSLSKRVGDLARNTLEVMRRGHRPDPRVPRPDPAYAQGASPDSLAYLKLNFVLWSAARDIAAGGEGVWLLDLLSPEVMTEVDLEPDHLGGMLAAGMADLLSLQPAALGARWAEFGPRLGALLDAAYQTPDRRRQRDLALATIMNQFQVRFEDADPDQTRTVALAALELGEPAKAVDPAGRDTVAVQLRRQGQPVGLLVSPILGPMSGADLAALAKRQFRYLPMTSVAPALKPWRSPRFWPAAIGALAAVGPLNLPMLVRRDRGRLKPLLRQHAHHAFIVGAEAVMTAGIPSAPAGEGGSPHAERLRALEAALASPPARPTAARTAPAPRHAPPVRMQEVSARLPILMYHRVADEGPDGLKRWRVDVDSFRRQMGFLRDQGFRSVTPQDWARSLRRHEPLPGRPILITFDDAYVDFAEHAWPILKDHGFTATVFVIAGKVGGVADWDADQGEAAPLLDWEGLRALAAEGVTIGSHSLTHRKMARLPIAEVYNEALASRARIAAELGAPPTAFCYPYGSHDRAVEQAVAECGYDLALSCIPAIGELADDPFRLPRIEVSGTDDPSSLARKLGCPIP